MPIGWAVTVVVLCVAVVVLAIVVLGLLRQVTPVLEQAATAIRAAPGLESQGPPVGHRIPDFTVSGTGGVITAEQLRGRPSVLLFLSVGCGPCEDLAAELHSSDPGDLTGRLVVVTEPDGPDKLRLPAGLRILIEQNREVSDPLSVIGTPFGIALDSAGIVTATGIPNTLEQLSGLLDR
ncbi:MAG TPA: hypothetical protein VGI74_06955 [Streptosporangiaceae bacterium]